MSNLWNRIRQNRWLSIGLILLLLAAVFLAFSSYAAARAAEALTASLQTEVAQSGNLTATIGATGTVRAAQSATLAWKSSGAVEQVAVEVGDSVREDEVLASLEQTSLPQTVILAQNDLEAARDQLENFYDSYGDLGLAEAQEGLAQAEDAVDSAQRRLNNLVTPATQDKIDQAYANLILAQQQLEDAQDFYENFANRPEDDYLRASAQSSLSQAQASYDSAERTYNAYINPSNDLDIAIAEAQLALTQAQLEQAQEKYDEIVDGPTQDAIAAAEARVIAAEATLKQAYIEAPFAGVITDVFATSGDLVSVGAMAFTLDDLDNLLVDVEVSEVDINRVAIGQAASLTFDAIPDVDYAGVVTSVALAGTVNQGAVNFRVTVQLTEPDEFVRPGMTAAVNIVVTELEDVLLVPNRAVRVLDGARVVYVLVEGQQQVVTVELGASSDTYSEVLGGELEAGDLIVLNPQINVFETSDGPPQGFGGGGGAP